LTGLRLLAGVFVVLAVTVAGEVADRPKGEIESPAASTQPAPAAPAPSATPTASRGEAWSATLLARPLFAPGRRPVPVAASPVPHETALPRLSGIVLSPGVRLAIFEVDHATRAIVVADGAPIDGWTVATIEADSVTLARDGSQSITLRPRFAGGTAAANLPPPPPMSRGESLAATGNRRKQRSNPQLQP
jgi:general secretion pathway protein N